MAFPPDLFETEDWGEFENCKLIEGSLDLFTDTNMCLVEQAFSEKYGGLHVGDKITLFGVTYTVNGIFSSFNYYEKILLPLPVSEQATESDITVSKLYLRTEEAMSDGRYIANTSKGTGLPVSNVKAEMNCIMPV